MKVLRVLCPNLTDDPGTQTLAQRIFHSWDGDNGVELDSRMIHQEHNIDLESLSLSR